MDRGGKEEFLYQVYETIRNLIVVTTTKSITEDSV